MKHYILFVGYIKISVLLHSFIRGIEIGKYLDDRNSLISVDKKFRVGSNLTLNAAEQLINQTLVGWKLDEIKRAVATNDSYRSSMHFFSTKEFIDSSPIFKMIKKMPKGAALHIHDASLVDIHWLIQNATYDDHCYACYDGILLFKFFQNPPDPDERSCNWVSVPKLRSSYKDPKIFDEMLYKNMTMIVDKPFEVYKTQDDIWYRFQRLFQTINGLVFYGPVTKAFYYEGLNEFYTDNVQYFEMRAMLPEVYESDGTKHDKDWLMQLYRDTAKQFVIDHPDFLGAKTIYTSSRSDHNVSHIKSAIKDAIGFMKKYPDHFAGYDIVGQEDGGTPLIDYIQALLYPSQQGISLPYFFHAGETNWMDYDIDLNIVDAILLNTTRIGHGYALSKHPQLMKLVKDRNIAIEVCPISNQVLTLVSDLRNHPATTLMAEGYPVVISSDDPALWGARGLSYDFYEAFMSLGGAWADLATLKQLAINSIKFSSLSEPDKQTLFNLWQKKWDIFVEEMTNVIATR